jgi:hypothetical protein
MASVPPDFEDKPGFFPAVPTTYWHALTIPTWDVVKDGVNDLIVGTPAVSWGFVVPEASTLTMVGIVVVMVVVFGWYRRRHA